MASKPPARTKAKQSKRPNVGRIELARLRFRSWLFDVRAAVVEMAEHKKTMTAVLVIIGVVLGIYFWHSHRSPAATGEAELKSVKAKVSRHFLLPNNEVPALATVTDTSKLTTPFFKGTKNGDRILIYQKSHLAIIYRPSIDRIVSVGPVTVDTPPTGKGQPTQ